MNVGSKKDEADPVHGVRHESKTLITEEGSYFLDWTRSENITKPPTNKLGQSHRGRGGPVSMDVDSLNNDEQDVEFSENIRRRDDQSYDSSHYHRTANKSTHTLTFILWCGVSLEERGLSLCVVVPDVFHAFPHTCGNQNMLPVAFHSDTLVARLFEFTAQRGGRPHSEHLALYPKNFALLGILIVFDIVFSKIQHQPFASLFFVFT